MAELDDLVDRLTGDLRGIVAMRAKMKASQEAAAVPPPPPPEQQPSEDDIAKVKQIIADVEGHIAALKAKISEHEQKAQNNPQPGVLGSPQAAAAASGGKK